MSDNEAAIAAEIERFLRTGQSDAHCAAWSGGFMERANRAHGDLRGALAREVKRLANGHTHQPLPESDTVALTRRKVEPMVRGLFPRAEQDAVLAALEKSVVFLTGDNIEVLLLGRGFDSTAWTLANLYLASLGADLLGEDAPRIVGLSEETTCYVSPEYVTRSTTSATLASRSAVSCPSRSPTYGSRAMSALIPNKSPGRLTFSDVTLECGATEDRDLFDWSANSFSTGSLDQDVAISSSGLGVTDANL